MKRAGLIYVLLGGFQRGLSLLLLPFVTRAMTVEEYGAVSVVVAIGAFASALLGTPLQAPVVRWTARGSDAAATEGLGAARCWLLLISPLLMIFSASLLWAHDGTLVGVDSNLIAIELVAIGLGLHLSYFTLSALRGRQQLGAYVVAASSWIVAALLTKVIFVIILAGGVLGWVISDLLSALVGLSVSLVVSRRDRISVRAGEIRAVLNFARPLAIQSVATWGMQGLSRPIMALLMPLSQVGIFSAAMNALNAAMIILFEFNKSAVVEYSRATSSEPSPELQAMIRFQRWLAVTVSLGVLALSPAFVYVILPSDYDGAAQLLGILAFGAVLLGIYDLPMNMMVYAAGRPRLTWVPSIVGSVLLVIGLYVLVPAAGVVGAGVATVVGYGGMVLASFTMARARGVRVGWRESGFSLQEIAVCLTALLPSAAASIFSWGIVWHGIFVLLGVFCLLALWRHDRHKGRNLRSFEPE